MRHRVVAVSQHSVKGFERSHQLGTGLGSNYFVEQCIDGRVFHANHIARAFGVCRLGTKTLEQFGARRLAATDAVADNFKIKNVY